MAGNVSDSLSHIPSKRSSEHPASAPASGVVAPSLFRGGSGPGYWINNAVTVSFLDHAVPPCDVIRMSPEALWFAPPAGFDVTSVKSLRVVLTSKDRKIGPLRARIVHLGARVETPCLGLRLLDPSIDAGRDILGMLDEMVRAGVAEPAFQVSPIQEEITEADRIRAIMGALTGVPSEGLRQSSGKLCRFQIKSVDLEHPRVTWTMLGDQPSDTPDGAHVIDIAGYNSVYRLHIPGAETREDGAIVTPFPTKVQRLRYRFFRRGIVRTAHRVEFRHPVWRDLWIDADIRDISFGGICFTTSKSEDLLFPGLVIPYLEVKTADGHLIGLRGQVRSVASVEGEDRDVCGMSVTAYWPEGEADWMRLASETLYPTTRTSEEMTEELWAMFDESGYFNLAGKTSEEFLEMKKGFLGMSKRGSEAPRLICQAVWPSQRGVEASVSFLKAYQHSWMGHQLARRPGKPPVELKSPGQIMRDIYLRAFEHPQADPDFDWMIGYIEPHVAWMEKAHLEFARKYVPTGHALALPMWMFGAKCSEMSGLEDTSLDIGPATEEEIDMLVQEIAATRPACYVEALDFDADRIGFDEIAQGWKAKGFSRSRAIHVARKHGVPTAAMVMETGEPGTNLFSLLDCMRVFPLADDAKAIYPSVFDHARRWYKSEGRSSYLYMREDDDWSYVEPIRLQDVSIAAFWVISSAILPDFLEHVCELTGRRRFGG
jgi:hypothetical protein